MTLAESTNTEVINSNEDIIENKLIYELIVKPSYITLLELNQVKGKARRIKTT